jgi:hypothetical protein
MHILLGFSHEEREQNSLFSPFPTERASNNVRTAGRVMELVWGNRKKNPLTRLLYDTGQQRGKSERGL